MVQPLTAIIGEVRARRSNGQRPEPAAPRSTAPPIECESPTHGRKHSRSSTLVTRRPSRIQTEKSLWVLHNDRSDSPCRASPLRRRQSHGSAIRDHLEIFLDELTAPAEKYDRSGDDGTHRAVRNRTPSAERICSSTAPGGAGFSGVENNVIGRKAQRVRVRSCSPQRITGQ